MARTYRLSAAQRVANAIYRRLTLWGFGAGFRHILTAPGRSTGIPRSTPVDVMTVDGKRFLVAPYGEVNWVRNARAAGQVTLRRGSHVEFCTVREVSDQEAIPVIRAYIDSVPITRAYWDVTAGSSDHEVRTEAAAHPVFELK